MLKSIIRNSCTKGRKTKKQIEEHNKKLTDFETYEKRSLKRKKKFVGKGQKNLFFASSFEIQLLKRSILISSVIDKITLFISHRKSTMQFADNIINLS